MIAMQLSSAGPIESAPLRAAELPVPEPAAGELLVRVRACGVCHTDLHVAEGDLTPSKLPIVPGHQVVGIVEKLGAGLPARSVGASLPAGAGGFKIGDRVGIAWLRWACGECRFCAAGNEKPLRAREVHRPRRGRRLRGVRVCPGGLRVCDPRRLLRSRGRAAALRGDRRLSRAAAKRHTARRRFDNRSGPPPWPVRFRRIRAHRPPDRAALEV